jgi:flagellar biosynthetic protein FliR
MITDVQLVLFVMVLARVSAFIAFFPLFARKQLPNLVKVGIAGALSFFWYGTMEAQSGLDANAVLNFGILSGALLVSKEILIGLVLSVAIGAFFLPAKIAGSYVGQELGLSLASINDPSSQDSSTLLSKIFETFCILLFFGLNLHHFLILVIHHSFEALTGNTNVLQLPTEELVTLLNRSNDYGFMIIAPAVILFMLTTLGLAFLTKAAPSLNLFSVGMPVRIGLGIFALFIFCPIVFGAVQTYLYRVQEDIEHILTQL